MKNKTKEELIELVEELQNKVEELENAVDYWQCEYNEMEEMKDKLDEELNNLSYSKDNAILNVNKFVRKLFIDGLDSEELRKFIEDYMRYDNNE